MAHEIESMAYHGETPWHKLGVEVFDKMTSGQAIQAAGLDWTVSLRDVYISGSNGLEKIEGQKAVVRDHDRRVYSVVGDRYTPIQNSDAFSFFDNVVGAGHAMYETCGSLAMGARIWILAKLNESMGVKGDQVDKYLTLVNSHDGTMALQMFWTPIRVVCQNTLSMALAGAGERFYSRHTQGIAARVDSAVEILGLTNLFYERFKEQAERLAVLQLPPAQMPLLLRAAFAVPESKRMEEVWSPIQMGIKKVEELVEVDRKEFSQELHGTRWEAFNAVAKYTDYYRDYRGGSDDARLKGAWFGGGADIKKRAWDYLVKA